MKHSLEVYSGDSLIFYSDSHWIYPLFEFEQFLQANDYDPAQLQVKDKIIGRAAALILIYLGIRHIKADLMSQLGKAVLDQFGIQNEHNHLVERIECATEELLKDQFDPVQAYDILRKRAKI